MNKKKEKSFTLIETIVAVAIFGMIIIAVFSAISLLYKVNSYTWQQSLAVDEARRGIKTMITEIREATFGEDGSYLIGKASDKEFIFYADVDNDGQVERVRYFLGSVNSAYLEKQCTVFSTGGSCVVSFSNFLGGNLKTATAQIFIEGDFGWTGYEYADVFADSQSLGRICQSGCSDCAGVWQGAATFDVTSLTQDGNIQFIVDSSSQVDNSCNWIDHGHAMKVKIVLSWEEDVPNLANQFKKGVTDPLFSPARYPLDQEKTQILSSYVRNASPIFEYYDENGDKIDQTPARLIDTKMMKVYLVVNVDLNRTPGNFDLESFVKLRNIK
jgi:type II secretory pathway pseudopilin PulG